MPSTLSLRQKQSVFALNLAKLIVWAYQQGYEVTMGEALRTEYQQAQYLRTGASRTANSQHLRKLAADLNLFWQGQLLGTAGHKPLGAYWCSLHPDNRWGGDFRRDGDRTTDDAWDGNHYEMMG